MLKQHLWHSVAFSISEAECVADTEAVKEVMSVIWSFKSMQIKVKLHIVVRVDNVAPIFMIKNVTTTGWSKHVDMCYKFVTE